MHVHSKIHRSGFTLLEISLVLVILVIVTAIAIPSFQGTLDQERLRKGAESIAADWTQTRALAMQTGETQVWACELGAGNYSASSSTGSGTNGETPMLAATDLSNFELSETLPTGIVISQAMTSESDSMSTMAQSAQSSESGRATLFFFPDGTSSNARLTVTHEDKLEHSMVVMINGLAGTVRVLQGNTSSGASQ